MIADLAFYLVAAFTLASGAAVVRMQNLFHAGIALISCFLGVAGIYILLGAPFVGAMQVLIYAGAIAVVLLFGFMLTHDLMHPKAERFQNIPGLATATLVGGMLSVTALATDWGVAGHPLLQGDVKHLAESYMTYNLVPFQLVALLLLVALIGSIVIARKEETKP